MSAGDDGLLVFRQAGAFKEERADLALKLVFGPVSLETFVFVEGALQRVINADEFNAEDCPGVLTVCPYYAITLEEI